MVTPAADSRGPSPTPFGQLVKQIREARGLSQPRLAKQSGVSAGYIANIERGSRGGSRPSRDKVVALARGLGVPPGELLEAAGLPLDAGDWEYPLSVEDAIRADARLTSWQKDNLINTYRLFVGDRPVNGATPGGSRS